MIRVTASMADGRVALYEPYLALDSILAWAWMQENHPDLLFNSDPARRELIEPDLPLGKVGNGDDWFWACDFAHVEQLKEEIAYWNRRVDAAEAEKYVDFQGRRGKLNTSSGRYKAYRMPLPVSIVPEITWTAEGDAAEVRRLLRRITHIGKKRSQGYGLVAEWVVEEVPGEWGPWMDGRLRRPVPASMEVPPDIPAYKTVLSIRPPYWHPSRKRVCVMPV